MEAACGQCQPRTDRVYFSWGRFNPERVHVLVVFPLSVPVLIAALLFFRG